MKLRNTGFYLRGYLRSKAFSRPPIIVGGCERSGTTLLQSILSAHPAIHAISDELWAFCHGYAAGFGGRRPIRVSRLYKSLGQEPGPASATRWCEKSPANVFFFDAILRHFRGQVKLIQIVRDGRDVVCSRHPDNPDAYWVPVQRWVDALEAGLPYRDNPHVHTIRYEDLILAYEATMRGVLSFLGEAFSEEMRDWHTHASIRASRNLMGSRLHRIHSSSVRKFESKHFAHARRVEEFMRHPAVPALLHGDGYV